MNETELERLVVRLTGDGEEYMRMLKQAQDQTRETAQIVEEQGKRIEGFSSNLRGFASSALSALAGLGIRNFLSESLAAWNEQEKAEKRLRAMYQVNERETEAAITRAKQFAEEMQNLTATADENTLAMLQQAEAMGVTGANAERAIRNVIAAQAAGIHIGVRQAALLEQGVLGRLGRQLGDLGQGSEQEKIAKAQEKLKKMFALAELDGKSAFKQLGVAWSELMEDFGKTFKQLMSPIVEMKTSIINWFRSLSDGTKQFIVVLGGVVLAVLSISAAITTAGIIFNTMFGGVGLIIGAIVTAGAATAYWLSTFESIKKAWETIKEVGGIAWDWIKGKAMAFWEWIRPAAMQTWNIILSLWTTLKRVVSEAWEWIKNVHIQMFDYLAALWSYWFGDITMDWDKLRKDIVKQLILVEFVLRNFKQTVELVFEFAKLKFMQWSGELEHWFQTRVPAFGRALQAAFSGEWSEAMTELLTNTTDRVIGAIERRQLALVQRLAGGWNAAYKEFEEARMNELFGPEQERIAEENGRRQQEATNKGKHKEIEKFEAAARASAEAVSRIYAYMDRVVENRRAGDNGRGNERREVVARMAPEAQARIEEHNRNVVVVLREIRDGIRQQEPQIVLDPVGLG